MVKEKFHSVSMVKGNPKWNESIRRENPLYIRENEVRSDFTRDYTRILHCTAYRRLKHKTQVFFATRNDHICTRIEHVAHVSSVSYTISKQLGLNTELATAIAIGHDLGHAPFGHAGEEILSRIAKSKLRTSFWHEQNSLHFVDNIETLPNKEDKEENLTLTYAVRDGVISHCGEVNDKKIAPRDKVIDLNKIKEPNQFSPFTWEGCVVKIADKISYLGRDIEDALALDILSPAQINQLEDVLRKTIEVKLEDLNNTVLMHTFISDLCKSSSPDKGIRFSKRYGDFIRAVEDFNDANIYNHDRLSMYKSYAKLIIDTIFNLLEGLYNKEYTYRSLWRQSKYYPMLIKYFLNWLLAYSDMRIMILERKIILRKRHDFTDTNRCANKIIYALHREKDYIKAIIDFISGMTDSFAIKVFNEITSF